MKESKELQFKKYGEEAKDRMMFKARKGDIEHKDNFNDLTTEDLIEEILDEVSDIANYVLRLRDRIK